MRSLTNNKKTTVLIVLIAIWAVALVIAAVGLLVRFHNGSDSSLNASSSGDSTQVSGNSIQSFGQTPLPSPSIQKPAPTFDQLKNSTLQIPQDCADFVSQYSRGEVQASNGQPLSLEFVDGEGQGLGTEVGSSEVTLLEAKSTNLPDQSVTVVEMSCWGGGTGFVRPFAVYDADLNMVSSFDPSSKEIVGETVFFGADHWDVSGTELTYETVPFSVFREPQCRYCPQSGTATVTMTWDTDHFTPKRVMWHTPDVDFLHFKQLNGDRPAIPDVNDTDPVTYNYNTADIQSDDYDEQPVFTATSNPADALTTGGPWMDQALADWIMDWVNQNDVGELPYPFTHGVSVMSYRSDGWALLLGPAESGWWLMHYVDGQWTKLAQSSEGPQCSLLVSNTVPLDVTKGHLDNCFLDDNSTSFTYTGPDGIYN